MLLKSSDRLEGGNIELLVIGTMGSLYIGVIFPWPEDASLPRLSWHALGQATWARGRGTGYCLFRMRRSWTRRRSKVPFCSLANLARLFPPNSSPQSVCPYRILEGEEELMGGAETPQPEVRGKGFTTTPSLANFVARDATVISQFGEERR